MGDTAYCCLGSSCCPGPGFSSASQNKSIDSSSNHRPVAHLTYFLSTCGFCWCTWARPGNMAQFHLHANEEQQPLMWSSGREINLQGVSARYLSVLLWLSGHKAFSLRRIIMPITEKEKQTVPTLHSHQEEEFATWPLGQMQHLWRMISICADKALKHQKWSTVLLLLCVCLILCNTWIRPKADVGENSGVLCPTPPVGFE